ncbi:hypothetical protein [Paraherbaspirillum soli]|uniref:Porin n=1 Tax=Paraherbaspirillum soli TaxID=631222 RepID=A0ABW0MDH1_9BURK
MRFFKCVAAALLGLSAAGAALADEAAASHQFSGDLRLDYYHVSKELDRRHDVVGATGDVKIESDWRQNISSKAVVRWHDPELSQTAPRTEVLEAFALWHSDRVDLKLGKQIVAWGRADGINPTDNLTPRNYRVQLPYEEDQRSGVSALKMNYFPDAQKTITLYLTPSFQPSKAPLPPDDGIAFLDQRPAHNRWPLAWKYDARGDRLDWSLSYFRGYKLLPEWQATDSASTVALHYPKISVFGADAALNLGRYGLRAEVARVLRDEAQTAGGFRSDWMLVAGVDRNFDDDLNINLQLIAQQTGNLADAASIVGADQRNLATVNAISFNQERKNKFGATMRIGKKWLNGTLEAELLAFSYFQPNTSYWRPLVAYALQDNVKLTVGAELYYGRANTYFGGSKSTQSLFAELRYHF